jgi:hypothetical protein
MSIINEFLLEERTLKANRTWYEFVSEYLPADTLPEPTSESDMTPVYRSLMHAYIRSLLTAQSR